MLKLLPTQIRALDREANDSFLAELQQIIDGLDGAFLPRFPAAVRRAIVGNLVARARSAGAQSQRAITVWCGLMCIAAPNLGADPAVRAWVARTGTTTDGAIAALADVLSPADLARIEAGREDLPLFTPASADRAPPEQRVAMALPLVLWDRVDAAGAQVWAQEYLRAAHTLGMDGLSDAPVALAVMAALYGTGADLWQHDWAQALRASDVPAGTRLSMLRARIMLDHGRWA